MLTVLVLLPNRVSRPGATTRLCARRRNCSGNPAMSLHQTDRVVSKLTRVIMQHGKKHAALRIIDDCFVQLRAKHAVEDPASFTRAAIDLAKPVVETRKYIVSGRTLHIPTPCRPHRQESLALRFIRDAFRARSEHGSGLRLANELVDLNKRSGAAFRMRDELHRKAEANRAFAHYVKG